MQFGAEPKSLRTTSLAVVAVEQVAEAAEDRPLFASAAAHSRHGRDDAVGQPAERERLQPDPAGSAKRRKEEPLSAKQRRFDLAYVLNVVLDRRLERDDAARVDANQFARAKGPLLECAAGVNEGPAIALQPLHDEPFTA